MSDEKLNTAPAAPALTNEEKFFAQFEDVEHMQLWLEKFLGFTLPDYRVTEYATSTPADFVFSVYKAMMQGDPMGALAIAGRDSGKTVGLSVLDLLAITHDQRNAVHFGMVTKQAKRARTYLDRYIAKTDFLAQRVERENSTEIVLKFGVVEQSTQVGLEILPCTKKAAQGAHGSFVSWDEIGSTVEPSILAGYRDSAGVPGASSKGKPAITVKISSRHASDSLVEREIESAEQQGRTVFMWTTLDTTERCTPERSGTVPTPLYIDTMQGLRYTPEELEQLPPVEQESFELTQETRDKCVSCPLVVYCKGRLRHQTSTSKLLRKIDDVITKIREAGSHEWALSQIMSLKASPEGRVYTHFSRSRNIPGWDVMWERLTGEKPGAPVSRQQFVQKALKTCSVYAGEDFGWSNPSTCVVICVDKKENVYVIDAFGERFKDDPDWATLVYDRVQNRYRVEMHVPDPENQSALSIFRKAGMGVGEVDKGAGSVKAGINVIKSLLRVPGTNDETKLFIAPDLATPWDKTDKNAIPGIADEFEMYRWQMDVDGKIIDDGNPEKGNDHFLDALRYVLYWLFGKEKATAVFVGDAAGNSSTPREQLVQDMARRSGIPVIDNRADFESPSDDDDDDDDGTPPPSGGMSFAW